MRVTAPSSWALTMMPCTAAKVPTACSVGCQDSSRAAMVDTAAGGGFCAASALFIM